MSDNSNSSKAWTLHQLFESAINLKDLDYDLPVAITKNGYFRVLQDCYIDLYLRVGNYKIIDVSLNPDQDYRPVQARLYLPEGFIFDSASIPWYGRIAVPEVGRHSLGAAFHDMLYRSAGALTYQDIVVEPNWMVNIQLDQKFADKVFNAINTELNVRSWRKTIMYRGVRLGGSSTFTPYLRDYNQNPIKAGQYVKGKGFAYSRVTEVSKVEAVYGNLLVVDGKFEIYHSVRQVS